MIIPKLVNPSYHLNYNQYLITQLYSNTIKWQVKGCFHTYIEPVNGINHSVTISGDYHLSDRYVNNHLCDPKDLGHMMDVIQHEIKMIKFS